MKKINKKILIFLLIFAVFFWNINQIKSSNIINKNIVYKFNYHIFIDVEESKMYIFESGNLIKIYQCAGGKSKTPSPIGTWKINKKAVWGEGYGGRFMGINCPWGQFGIHGTNKEESIGMQSSHGCIRMKVSDVEELYNYIPVGTKVTIVDGPYGNFGHGFRIINPGMYGADVYEIQFKLKQLGLLNIIPNGKYGTETEKSIRAYCKRNNLKSTKIIDINL